MCLIGVSAFLLKERRVRRVGAALYLAFVLILSSCCARSLRLFGSCLNHLSPTRRLYCGSGSSCREFLLSPLLVLSLVRGCVLSMVAAVDADERSL
jgi:hypothetical protein